MTVRFSVNDVTDDQGVITKREANAILINVEFVIADVGDVLALLEEITGRFIKKCIGPQLEERIGQIVTGAIDMHIDAIETGQPQLGKLMLQTIFTDKQGPQLAYRMCPVPQP